mmetsp:Transcript_25434/g.81338  ORF Transcript_25434/g.81338 Transcript_25434/m.81338 type:complete len:330 (+) Transcript_25434:74-1063(+)
MRRPGSSLVAAASAHVSLTLATPCTMRSTLRRSASPCCSLTVRTATPGWSSYVALWRRPSNIGRPLKRAGAHWKSTSLPKLHSTTRGSNGLELQAAMSSRCSPSLSPGGYTSAPPVLVYSRSSASAATSSAAAACPLPRNCTALARSAIRVSPCSKVVAAPLSSTQMAPLPLARTCSKCCAAVVSSCATTNCEAAARALRIRITFSPGDACRTSTWSVGGGSRRGTAAGLVQSVDDATKPFSLQRLKRSGGAAAGAGAQPIHELLAPLAGASGAAFSPAPCLRLFVGGALRCTRRVLVESVDEICFMSANMMMYGCERTVMDTDGSCRM